MSNLCYFNRCRNFQEVSQIQIRHGLYQYTETEDFAAEKSILCKICDSNNMKSNKIK